MADANRPGAELVWMLGHVWPKGAPDLTERKPADDDEARRLVEQVEAVKREFERFFAEDLVPRISREPTRAGVVESVRLFISQHSMNTDYLLLVSGIVGGSGGIVQLIEERYTTTAAGLGRFEELPGFELPGA